MTLPAAITRFNAAFDRAVPTTGLWPETVLALIEVAALRGRGDLAADLWSAWQADRGLRPPRRRNRRPPAP